MPSLAANCSVSWSLFIKCIFKFEKSRLTWFFYYIPLQGFFPALYILTTGFLNLCDVVKRKLFQALPLSFFKYKSRPANITRLTADKTKNCFPLSGFVGSAG